MKEIIEHPIAVTDRESQAIMNGCMTQIRRVVAPQPPKEFISVQDCSLPSEGSCFWWNDVPADCDDDMARWWPSYDESKACPYGQPGDRLWVRESIGFTRQDDDISGSGDVIAYRSGGGCVYENHEGEYLLRKCKDGSIMLPNHWIKPPDRWFAQGQMPRWACRMLLDVTAVRVERVQEISNADARASGLPHAYPHRHGPQGIEKDGEPADPYGAKHETGYSDCWICPFKDAWNDLNGKPGHSWASNPWVWVLDFKRV